MPTTFAQPGLYRTGPDGTPRLAGRRCRACGFLSFPYQEYGCENCGDQAAVPVALAVTGVVRAAATVHSHPDPKVVAPFTIVSVALDAGPVVRGRLAGRAGTGDRVRGRFLAAGDDPDAPLELRFEGTR